MSRFIIAAAAMVVVGGVAGVLYGNYSAPAAPEQSPLATSERLAPAASNPFEGRIKPVPELISRAEAEAQGRGIPASIEGFDEAEQYMAPLRDNQKKGPSGLWILTHYYFAFRDAIAGAYDHPSAIKDFDRILKQWEAKGHASPGPYILKGFLLRNSVTSILYSRRQKVPADTEALMSNQAAFTSYLKEVKPIAAKDPVWYMLQINAMAFTCNMPAVWDALEEGSKTFPTFYQNYFDTLLFGLRCSEDGEHLINRLIDLGTERTRATEGESFYARMFWVASQYWTDEVITSDMIDWTRMKTGVRDVLERYPDPWNVNNFARFACLGRQADLARELLPKVLEWPVVEVWGSNERFKTCWDWAMTTAGK